jgi:hypothetical protein
MSLFSHPIQLWGLESYPKPHTRNTVGCRYALDREIQLQELKKGVVEALDQERFEFFC